MPLAAAAPIPFQNCPTCLGGGGGGTTPVNLNDLTDVVLTGPLAPGSALVFNGVSWVNQPNTLDNLVDVDATAPTNGQTIVFDAGLGRWVLGAGGIGPHALTDHTDVTITPPLIDGHVLTYDTVTSQWVNEPPIAGCFRAELGGVSGQLAVGDGTGVPNPVATGWTLTADSIRAILATPSVGGNTTVEVRLLPANTVITTLTFPTGAQTPTATPFADLALLNGQWIESVVTAVPAVPGSELTVIGSICGPGTSGGGGGPLPALSFIHTQAAAASTWTITHGLTFTPSGIHIEDGAGNDIEPANVTFTATQVVVQFLAPQAGTARVS